MASKSKEIKSVDKYVSSVMGGLKEISSDLASDTNVENMVSIITSKYLQKYAEDDSKNAVEKAMKEFFDKHAGFDIGGQLADVRHRIAIELHNIRRVVDDGNFHVTLSSNVVTPLNVIYDIPLVCKISLEDQMPPLHVKVLGLKKHIALQAYASYKCGEPNANNCNYSKIDAWG